MAFGKGPEPAQQQKTAQEKKTQEELKKLRDAHSIDETFELYKLYSACAVREKDLSICKQSLNPGGCLVSARFLQTVVDVGHKKCDEIKDPSFKKLCEFGKNRCEKADDSVFKDVCVAVDTKDVEALQKASYKPEWAVDYGLLDEEDARIIMSLYYGSLTDSLSACTDMSGGNIFIDGICRVLFEPGFNKERLPRLLDEQRAFFRRMLESGDRPPDAFPNKKPAEPGPKTNSRVQPVVGK